jgi:4-hydroxy-tetrahydrodipicolinate synthase
MLTVSLYSMGGKGVISVLANAYPVIFRKLRTYADSGSMVKASQELSRLLDINGPMYDEGNPVGVKYLLSTMGICEPHVRLPMVEASKGLKARIDKISLEAGK